LPSSPPQTDEDYCSKDETETDEQTGSEPEDEEKTK